MKLTKRLLALLLTLALALGLAMPASAAVNWDEFKITKQPQDLTIKQGESFTLSVEVAIPDGVEVEYQWRSSGTFVDNATSAELRLSPGNPHYPENNPQGGSSARYECWITAYVKNADENATPIRIRSDTVSVVTERTFGGKLLDVTIGPFFYTFSSVIVTAPVSIPLLPLSIPYFLIYFFIQGFKGLF